MWEKFLYKNFLLFIRGGQPQTVSENFKMEKRFTRIRKIPKIPIFRRDAYEIPKEYLVKYKKAGIKDPAEQKLFFI